MITQEVTQFKDAILTSPGWNSPIRENPYNMQRVTVVALAALTAMAAFSATVLFVFSASYMKATLAAILIIPSVAKVRSTLDLIKWKKEELKKKTPEQKQLLEEALSRALSSQKEIQQQPSELASNSRSERKGQRFQQLMQQAEPINTLVRKSMSTGYQSLEGWQEILGTVVSKLGYTTFEKVFRLTWVHVTSHDKFLPVFTEPVRREIKKVIDQGNLIEVANLVQIEMMLHYKIAKRDDFRSLVLPFVKQNVGPFISEQNNGSEIGETAQFVQRYLMPEDLDRLLKDRKEAIGKNPSQTESIHQQFLTNLQALS